MPQTLTWKEGDGSERKFKGAKDEAKKRRWREKLYGSEKKSNRRQVSMTVQPRVIKRICIGNVKQVVSMREREEGRQGKGENGKGRKVGEKCERKIGVRKRI